VAASVGDLDSEMEAPPWRAGPQTRSRSEGAPHPASRPKYKTGRNTCTFRYLVKCVAAGRRNFGSLTAFQFPPLLVLSGSRRGPQYRPR